MKERPILFSTEMVRAILDDRKTMTRRVVKPQPPEDWGVKCPYGKIGDVLWVRETFCKYKGDYLYKADFDPLTRKEFERDNKWKPSIFMPRSASRISLRITNIRVERLNDITEEDAKLEGVIYPANPVIENYGNGYRTNFRLLWESINGKASWGQNPWVWVIEFERLK